MERGADHDPGNPEAEGGDASLLNAILEVTDDDGEIVLEFPFAEAIIDNSENSETKH